MTKEKILIIGACGQIGVELTLALRKQYGSDQVIASDIKDEHELLVGTGPFTTLNAMDGKAIHELVKKEGVTQIYLLAAVLSATGEKDPKRAWDINMQSLIQVLDIGVEEKLSKIYWPSSIAVFGLTTPRQHTPQETVVEPGTVYGISKYAGELWCQYYHQKYGLDVRSLRYPGLIGYKSLPGGGTTDYAVDIYHKALNGETFECFLNQDTYLPMMYMPDALKATLDLMHAPARQIRIRSSYNLTAMSLAPADIAAAIQQHIPDFSIAYEPDYRQQIAESWPQSIDDTPARQDWNWQPQYDLQTMTLDMLENLRLLKGKASAQD